MYALRRQALLHPDFWPLAAGAALTLAVAVAAAQAGAALGLAAVLALLAFFAAATAWIVVPHVAVALAIPLFVFLPSAKIFVSPWLGGVKDVVAVAAVGAIVAGLRRRSRTRTAAPVDRAVFVLVATLLTLYLVNVGGFAAGVERGAAWAHGVRLVAEPLILLLAALVATRPARTLAWGTRSLVATASVVAAYGLFQQYVGAGYLVELGYLFDIHVRTIDGRLRSFGTLDEPFGYAAVLMLALATVLFGMRRSPLAVAVATLLSAGLVVSYVRTGAIVAVALIALWLVRAGRATLGVVALAAAGVAAATLLLGEGAVETRAERADANTYITINGRTSAWKTMFEDPADLPFGFGVGQVGTAAERARHGAVVNPDEIREHQTLAVDSGYFAAVADVGLVGLMVLLALLVRLVVLGAQGARRGDAVGWLVLAYLTVLMLDAVLRSSFTGFPSAFVGMLLVGTAVATLAERELPVLPRSARR